MNIGESELQPQLRFFVPGINLIEKIPLFLTACNIVLNMRWLSPNDTIALEICQHVDLHHVIKSIDKSRISCYNSGMTSNAYYDKRRTI